MRILLSVLLLSLSLAASVEAQAPKTLGELLSDGYEIKDGFGYVILQLDNKAYLCELPNTVGEIRSTPLSQSQCYAMHNE